MAYALVYCRMVYTDVIYHLYNLRLGKMEVVNYDKLLYLLYSDTFVNLKLQKDGTIFGIQNYLDNIGNNIFTCYRYRDGKYTCIDEYGRSKAYSEHELVKLSKKDRQHFMNLTFKSKKVVFNDLSEKIQKLARKDVHIYLHKLYITFMAEEDECLVLCDTAYCDYYGIDMKAFRLVQKFYNMRADELEFDGVTDEIEVQLVYGNEKLITLTDKSLLNKIASYLKDNYEDMQQWDETNQVYCMGIDLTEEDKERLKIIIKNS